MQLHDIVLLSIGACLGVLIMAILVAGRVR